MAQELVFFHEGLNYSARSVLQKPGYLKTAKNVGFSIDGETSLRERFTKVNTTAVGSIHSIKRFRNRLLIGDGKHLRERSAASAGDFTDLYSSFADAPWQFREYKDFLHCANGTDMALFDASGNLYPAQPANPSTSPSGAAGAAGNPSGHYRLYVSFLITFPNGMTYETGLCAASADVNVTSQKISWTSIPVSTYAAYYGTAPTIHRKLYRGPGTGGTLADIYYVTVITDNTTTTYTDDFTDEELADNGGCDVEDYEPLPDATYHAYHNGRWYGIDATYENRMVYSEAAAGDTATENEIMMPIATMDNDWDDLRVAACDAVDPMGMVSWGGNLYVALKQTWLMKRGDDPDTWAIRKTWANLGIGAPYTISPVSTPGGILGLSVGEGGTPFLTLFNGQSGDILTSPILDYLLKTDLDMDYIENCRGMAVGRKYHLLYPSNSATSGTPDSHLCIDLTRLPDIRTAKWDGLNAVCLDAYNQGQAYYFGGSDGYVYKHDTASTEVVDVDVETHDLAGGGLQLTNIMKTLKELKYNLDTDDDDVTLVVYIDGTAATWPDGNAYKTISGGGDEIQLLKFPPNFRGYNYRLRVYASDLTTFTIYSPWTVDFDVTA